MMIFTSGTAFSRFVRPVISLSSSLQGNASRLYTAPFLLHEREHLIQIDVNDDLTGGVIQHADGTSDRRTTGQTGKTKRFEFFVPAGGKGHA